MVVDIAVDGRDSVYAFAKSSSGQYDIILMDIRMPVMDGCEATRAIRALNRPDAQTIPIIAMTADPSPSRPVLSGRRQERAYCPTDRSGGSVCCHTARN